MDTSGFDRARMSARRVCCVCCVFSLLSIAMSAATQAQTEEQTPTRYALAIHGGAGAWKDLSPEDARVVDEALRQALATGRDILAAGGSSLDAVERAVRVLEDAPQFNAGKGATYNAEGRHELDASIMDGRDRSAGAVAAVTVAKNPISLARLVMTKTPHVLISGPGADQFARRSGVEVVEPNYFWTDQTRRRFEASRQSRVPKPVDDHYGTVGCVALDQAGNLAAGTSTGGLTDKHVGRIGDSPIIGAGTFADNATCAVSCTGVGELFLRHAIAYDISARIQYAGESLEAALKHHIEQQLEAGTGGIIALNRQGRVVVEFNTRAMPHGIADHTGRFEVVVLEEE